MGSVVYCETEGCPHRMVFERTPPEFWMCDECHLGKRPYEKPTVTEVAPPRGAEDYGPTCNARFALPEQTCGLPPRHEGDHQASYPLSGDFDFAAVAAVARGTKWSGHAAERFEIMQWAGDRPGVLSLLRALRDRNYDETGTEYLHRIVSNPSGESRRMLLGKLVGLDNVERPLETCECIFVQRIGDEESYGRVTSAACEVHGGAEASLGEPCETCPLPEGHSGPCA